jgi:hypothetical protein
MATLYQNLADRYYAGVKVSCTGGNFRPGRDETDGTETGMALAVTQVDANGNPIGGGVTTATTTTTAITTASQQIAAAAPTGTQSTTVGNTGTGTLYVLLGTGTASATNYTYAIAAGATQTLGVNWTGVIQGVGSAASGNAVVTRYSP